MNKAEQRQANQARHIMTTGFGPGSVDHEDRVGFAARSISATIRSAMTKKSQVELMRVALELQLTNHPDFII
jgi:hypothetical protein